MRCHKEPHKQRGGYLHAEDVDTPYDVDGLRYCGRCHHFLGECESRRASAAPVATPTCDIDPEEVRRALLSWRNDPVPRGVEYLVMAARAWLASLPPDTTTPAPDVQAQERDPLIFLDTMSHDLAMAAAEEEDVQAQIDAAYERGVADGLRKARS